MKYGLAGGAGAWFYGFMEEIWDQQVRKGKIDAGGSVFAGTSTAMAFAMWKRMGLRPTWRCLKVGMGLGLFSGILQDLVRWSRGAPPWYVESIRERRSRSTQKGLENPKP